MEEAGHPPMSTDPNPIRPAEGDLSKLKALLLIARATLVQESPFLGSLVMKLPLAITEDKRVRTAGVDGRGWCYFGREFLSRLKLEELRAILLHETLHLALDVFGRMGARHRLRWNVAHDFAVNALIEESELSQGFLAWPTEFPPLLDKKYFHMPAEEIYEILPENLEELGLSHQDVLTDLWDHLDEDSRKEIRRQWRDRLIQAAEQAMGAEGIGNLPDWAQKLLGPLLAPQVPWQVKLAQKVHGRLRGRRRTYSRPGRRSHALGVILPGPRPNRGVVGVFVDVSGSIGPDELGAFMGELTGILRDGDVAVRMITWDTEVTDDQLLDDPDALRGASMAPDLVGGGGTDPHCVIDHLDGPDALKFPMPTFGILLTDGYVNWPDSEDWPMDVLVVTTGVEPPPELGYDWVKIETKEGPE